MFSSGVPFGLTYAYTSNGAGNKTSQQVVQKKNNSKCETYELFSLVDKPDDETGSENKMISNEQNKVEQSVSKQKQTQKIDIELNNAVKNGNLEDVTKLVEGSTKPSPHGVYNALLELVEKEINVSTESDLNFQMAKILFSQFESRERSAWAPLAFECITNAISRTLEYSKNNEIKGHIVSTFLINDSKNEFVMLLSDEAFHSAIQWLDVCKDENIVANKVTIEQQLQQRYDERLKYETDTGVLVNNKRTSRGCQIL